MATSPETQRVLDNYAASVGGVQDTRHTLKDTSQEASPFLRALAILGSLTLLTACTTAPAASSSTPSLKEKTVSTTTETTAPKRIMDGSRPFTLPEIEERLLKVLALPPAQISKESVEKIFGVVLEGDDRPWFFEEISADKQVVFAVTTYANRPGVSIFRYRASIKKISENDQEEYWEENPREIPAAYKFAYSEFVQKLEGVGWKKDEFFSDHGVYWRRFWKDDFRLEAYVDEYREDLNGQPDFSQTRISRVVIHSPNKR